MVVTTTGLLKPKPCKLRIIIKIRYKYTVYIRLTNLIIYYVMSPGDQTVKVK